MGAVATNATERKEQAQAVKEVREIARPDTTILRTHLRTKRYAKTCIFTVSQQPRTHTHAHAHTYKRTHPRPLLTIAGGGRLPRPPQRLRRGGAAHGGGNGGVPNGR